MLLSVEGADSLRFSMGSLLVLLACVCWGFENNCTRVLSDKDPLEIVVVKALVRRRRALLIAFAAGERLPAAGPLLLALLLGFVAYGLSIFCYIRAQRALGAAKTSAWYALAPFIGTGLSLVLLNEPPAAFFPARARADGRGGVPRGNRPPRRRLTGGGKNPDAGS